MDLAQEMSIFGLWEKIISEQISAQLIRLQENHCFLFFFCKKWLKKFLICENNIYLGLSQDTVQKNLNCESKEVK